jgi:TolA-binding protein
MSLNRYEQAILSYQEVIKKYPKGNKVPSALLRQAMAFVEIKDEMSAKLILKKIIKNYPKSNEAKIAQTRLKSLSR